MILTFFKGFLREVRRLWEDKRMLFMFFIAPVALSIVVCGAFSNHIVKDIRLAAVDSVSSAKTRELIRAFDTSDRFEVTAVLQDQEEAKRMLEAGDIEGILVIPSDYTTALQLGQGAEVLVGVDSSNNIVGNSAVVSIMQVVKTVSTEIAVKSFVATGSSIAEGTAKAMPISTVLRPWFNPQFSYQTYLGLGLTGLIFHQLFLMAVSSAFAEEKKDGILMGAVKKRDCIVYFFNKYIFYSVLGFANILVNFYAIIRLFGFPMRGSWSDLILLCGCFILSVMGLGAVTGLLCKNALHALQWLMALTYPFFILSGFSWPLSEMPSYLVRIAQALPSTHFLSPVRDIVLMGIGFDTASLAYSRRMLLLLAAIGFVLSLVVFLYQILRNEKKQTAAGDGKEAVSL